MAELKQSSQQSLASSSVYSSDTSYPELSAPAAISSSSGQTATPTRTSSTTPFTSPQRLSDLLSPSLAGSATAASGTSDVKPFTPPQRLSDLLSPNSPTSGTSARVGSDAEIDALNQRIFGRTVSKPGNDSEIDALRESIFGGGSGTAQPKDRAKKPDDLNALYDSILPAPRQK